MIRLLRLWLPVLPLAMVWVLVSSAMPETRPCLVESMFFPCAAFGPPAEIIGPVDLARSSPIEGIEGTQVAVVWMIVGVLFALVGARRLRATTR